MNAVKFFYLYSLFTCFSTGYAQNFTYKYKINYLYQFQSNQKDTNSKKEELMYLFANDEKSYFISANRLNLDTLLENVNDLTLGLQIGRSQHKPHVHFLVEKDYTKKQVTFYEKFIQNTLKEQTGFQKIQWNMKNTQTKMIGKYLCKLATTHLGGRTFEAWYTEEIPIPEGPYKFANLPGLILELYDTQKHHYFVATQIERKKNSIHFPIAKWENTAQKATMKEILKARENRVHNIDQGAGIRLQFDNPETMKKLKERIKQDNNPIELE